MARFGQLHIEPMIGERSGRQLFRLIRDFDFLIDAFPGVECSVTVPQGYVTDFASVPRFFWRVFPPTGKYTRSAVVHDYLCDIRIDQPLADAIFLAAMKQDGVKLWRRTTIYYAVRAYQTILGVVGCRGENSNGS